MKTGSGATVGACVPHLDLTDALHEHASQDECQTGQADVAQSDRKINELATQY